MSHYNSINSAVYRKQNEKDKSKRRGFKEIKPGVERTTAATAVEAASVSEAASED